MKRKILCLMLALFLLCPFVPASASGSPTAIRTLADLEAFAAAVNGGHDYAGETVTLEADITGIGEWQAVGYSSVWDGGKPFNGVFDGQGHTLSGMVYTEWGFFQNVGSPGVVRNIHFHVAGHSGNPDIVAGIAYINEGQILNCVVSGTVSSGTYAEGVAYENSELIGGCLVTAGVTATSAYGLMYYNDGQTIGCAVSGAVTGQNNACGLLDTNRAEIRNCSVSGSVTSTGAVACGLENLNMGAIRNCYNAAAVSGAVAAAGLANFQSTLDYLGVSIVNCYNAGDLSGPATYGVARFWMPNGTAANCFWLAGPVGAPAGSTDGMASFDTAGNLSGGTLLDALDTYAASHTGFARWGIVAGSAYPYPVFMENAPAIGASLSAASLTFSNDMEGYIPQSRTLTLSNTGTFDMAFTSAWGEATPDFTCDPASFTVPAGGQIILTLSPNPGLAPGAHTDTLTLTSGFGAALPCDVSFTVQAAATHGLSVDPASLDFGSVTEGYADAPEAKTVTVTNTGNVPVTLVLPDPAEFTVTGPSSLTLAAGANLTLSVRPKLGLKKGGHTERIAIVATDTSAAAAAVAASAVEAALAVDEKMPDTGDSGAAIYYALFMALAVGALLMARGRRKKAKAGK